MPKLKLGAKIVNAPVLNIAQETEATTLTSNHSVSTIKIQELTEQSHAITSELSNLNTRLNNAMSQVEEVKARREAAVTKLTKANRELAQQQEALQFVQADVATKQEALEAAKEKYHQAKQALDSATEPATQTSMKLSQVEKEIANNDTNLSEIQDRIEQLDQTNEVITQELEHLSSQNADNSPKVGWLRSWLQSRQYAAETNRLTSKYNANQVLVTQLAEEQKLLDEESQGLRGQKDRLTENLKILRQALQEQGKLFQEANKAHTEAQQAYETAIAEQDEASALVENALTDAAQAEQDLTSLAQTYHEAEEKAKELAADMTLRTTKAEEIHQEIATLKTAAPELELETAAFKLPPQTRLHRSSSPLPPANLTSITNPLSESALALTTTTDKWSARSCDIVQIELDAYEARINDESITMNNFNAEELAALDLMDYMIHLKREPGQMIAITEGSEQSQQLMLMRAAAHGLTEKDITIGNKSPEEIAVLLNQHRNSSDEFMKRIMADTSERRSLLLEAPEPTIENTTASFSPGS